MTGSLPRRTWQLRATVGLTVLLTLIALGVGALALFGLAVFRLWALPIFFALLAVASLSVGSAVAGVRLTVGLLRGAPGASQRAGVLGWVCATPSAFGLLWDLRADLLHGVVALVAVTSGALMLVAGSPGATALDGRDDGQTAS